ncbi:MAG: winged helix-turn-helix transcriptional regulator [Huintestinicola sp.]|uniref:winged helix-turn-helix transcriptional regulator n=1 Tax=Huintestinicola sp. TaxID=2981661 RepID=UPI003F0BEE03
MKTCPSSFNCPVEATIELIGGKYKSVILWHLTDGIKRFGELKRLLPRATEKMLAQQLRDLERDGLIIRTVYPVVPPKVEYSLSDLGRTIIPVLDAMCGWGEGYLASLKEKDRE